MKRFAGTFRWAQTSYFWRVTIWYWFHFKSISICSFPATWSSNKLRWDRDGTLNVKKLLAKVYNLSISTHFNPPHCAWKLRCNKILKKCNSDKKVTIFSPKRLKSTGFFYIFSNEQTTMHIYYSNISFTSFLEQLHNCNFYFEIMENANTHKFFLSMFRVLLWASCSELKQFL